MDSLKSFRRTFINRYLDSPIIRYSQDESLAQLLLLSDTDKALRGQLMITCNRAVRGIFTALPDDVEYQGYDPHDLAGILHALPNSYPGTGLSEAHQIANTLWTYSTKSLSKIVDIESFPSVPEKASVEARSWMSKAMLFVKFEEKLSSSRVSGGIMCVEETHESITLIGDQYTCVLLFKEDNLAIVLGYEVVLMIKDLCLSRHNIFTALSVVYNNHSDLYDSVKKILLWCEECLYVYGNKGYEVLKQIEPICKSYIIYRTDPVLGEGGSFDRIREMVQEKEQKFGGSAPYLVDKLVEICAGTTRTEHLVELFGLQKLTGHPLIDPRIGGESAAYEASIPRDTLYSDALKLRNNWCRMYLEGYVNRNKDWPPLWFPKSAKSTRLYQLSSIGERKLHRNSYPLEDWTNVRFKKHCEFDYYTNFTDLMDDKSLSFYRSDFRASWDKKVTPRSHKRLLMEMLSREEITIRDIILQVESGNIPLDWLIVSLYPKEREFKLQARMFSMMVFEMRVFFNCLEANLADSIFPSLPQQTMTLSKIEIQQRFFRLSKPKSDSSVWKLILEVDLSRWNLRWRDLPIRMVGNDLNDIFGMAKAFTMVHEFFSSAMIVVRVNDYPPEGFKRPDPPASSLLWYNHEGGFEGISQKHWTIATYSMIDLGLAEFNLSYSLLGQGDNQIVLADVYDVPASDPKAHLVKLSSEMKESISESCARVGQDAKPEECLESTTVATYSKDFYINGAEYHLSLKAFSRIFPHGSSDFPTIFNAIASLSSGCTAAAERLKQPILGYYLFLYHASLYLISLRDRGKPESVMMSKKAKRALDTPMITKLLMLPSSLGGLPIVGLMHFLYKGGPDPLMKDYECLRLLENSHDPFPRQVNHALLTGLWYTKDPEGRLLLADPYSLPISKPSLAENRVQRISQAFISDNATNRDLRELMSVDVGSFESSLEELLLECSPFNPVLLGDVLKFSIVGARDMTSKMFSTTRTVMSFIVDDEEDPGSLILSTSVDGFWDVVRRITNIPSNKRSFGNLYASVEKMREYWGKGNKRPVGVTSTSLLDWKIHRGESGIPKDGIRVIYKGSSDSQYTAGTEDPYLGSATKEKRTSHGYKIVVSSSADNAVSRLHKISTQPGVSESFKKLIWRVASSRTDTSLEQLSQKLSDVEGGSVAHRYGATVAERAASVLGFATFCTHAVLDSDNAGYLSTSKEDRPVMFQAYLAFGLSLLNIIVRTRPERPEWLCFEVPEGIPELPDETIVAPDSTSLIVPKFKLNKIAYTLDLTLIKEVSPYNSSVLSPLTKEEVASLHARTLVTSFVTRSLKSQNSAHSVADQGIGSIRIPLDLLEFRGLGSRNVIEGTAAAICQFAQEALFARPVGSVRWSPLPVIISLCSAVTPSLHRALTHPMFAEDSYANDVAPTAGLTYSRKASTRRLQVKLSNLAHRYFMNPMSFGNQLEVLLYEDDKEHTTSTAIQEILHRILLGTAARGEITPELCYTLARTHIIMATRGCATVAEKITGLLRISYVFQEWSEANNLMFFCSSMRDLLKGKLLRLAPFTLTSAIRASRSNAILNDTISVISLRSRHTGWSREILMASTQRTGELVIPSLGQSKSFDTDYFKFSLRRRQTRSYGLEAAAVNTFETVGEYFRDQVVVILGNGNGGAAAVACVHGALTVIGHDLMRDLSPVYWAKDDPGPPILRRLGHANRFSRSRAGFQQNGGSILESDTWKDLAKICVAGATIVIDIPLDSARDIHKILHHCSINLNGVVVVWRFLIAVNDNAALLGSLLYSRMVLDVITVFESDGYNELLVVLKVEKLSSLIPARTSSQISHPATVLTPADLSRYGGGVMENRERLLGDFLTLAIEDFEIEDEMWGSLALAPMSRSDHAFTYDQWTRATLALCFRCLDGLSHAGYVDLLAVWRLRDSVTFEVRSITRMLSMSREVRAILFNEYPRCRRQSYT